MRRMKPSQVSAVALHLLKSQNHECPLCNGPMGPGRVKGHALDHDHATGYIRDVLCINCNGIEGKIANLVRRMGRGLDRHVALANLSAYWLRHVAPQHGGILHHTHKTEEEKRLERLKKAKAARDRKKAGTP